MVRVKIVADVLVGGRPDVNGLMGAIWLAISSCSDSTENAELREDVMACGS